MVLLLPDTHILFAFYLVGILKSKGRDDFAKLFNEYWPAHFDLEKKIDCYRFHRGLKPIGWDFPVPKYKGLAEDKRMMMHWRKYQKELKMEKTIFQMQTRKHL